MESLNFDKIANECAIFDEHADINIIQQNFDSLDRIYSESDLIRIYNYFLEKSINPDITLLIIQNLDKYRHPSSLQYLVDVLLLRNTVDCEAVIVEKYNKVKIFCAKAIANQKNTDVVSALLYCLNNKDENYRVRLACADALGRIGDKYAVAPLIEIAKDDEEKSVYVRESAVSALAMLGDTRALDPLISIIEAKQAIMGKFSFLKERAIEALIKMGFCKEEKVFNAIKMSLMDESPQVRINAIEALMDSNHSKSYDLIKNCLDNDKDFEVQKNAMIALYNMSDRGILDEIIKSDKYSDSLKIEAVAILSEYESEERTDE